jgi:hypothetical protein
MLSRSTTRAANISSEALLVAFGALVVVLRTLARVRRGKLAQASGLWTHLMTRFLVAHQRLGIFPEQVFATLAAHAEQQGQEEPLGDVGRAG